MTERIVNLHNESLQKIDMYEKRLKTKFQVWK